MLTKDRLHLSTIDPEAGNLARTYGLGIEIAEFCTAYNLDEQYSQTAERVSEEIHGISRRILHGPFNELFPCAIDPLARKLAAQRFSQALDMARNLDAAKLILHGGFVPRVYYPCWYVEQTAIFWKEFLAEHPGEYQICLENVLEPEPEMLLEIVRQVDDPRLQLCLDVGHVNAYSQVPAMQWIAQWGEHLSHIHLHNNDGTADTHSSLNEGSLDLEALISALPQTTTATLELPEVGRNVDWMMERGVLK